MIALPSVPQWTAALATEYGDLEHKVAALVETHPDASPESLARLIDPTAETRQLWGRHCDASGDWEPVFLEVDRSRAVDRRFFFIARAALPADIQIVLANLARRTSL